MNISSQPDLFGFAPPSARKRGRPRYLPSAADRALVIKLHRDGASQPVIARALGITEPTLRLNYHNELGSTSQAWRRRPDCNGEME